MDSFGSDALQIVDVNCVFFETHYLESSWIVESTDFPISDVHMFHVRPSDFLKQEKQSEHDEHGKDAHREMVEISQILNLR